MLTINSECDDKLDQVLACLFKFIALKVGNYEEGRVMRQADIARSRARMLQHGGGG
jgi:hypothetical protein